MNTGWWEIDIHGSYSLVHEDRFCANLALIWIIHQQKKMFKFANRKLKISWIKCPLLCFVCSSFCISHRSVTLKWRHNGRDSVSNHQPHDCLLNRLFRRRSKKTSKLCVTGLCAGNSPVTGEFPAQMASNAENVSIWWRHHVLVVIIIYAWCTCTSHKCVSSWILWVQSPLGPRQFLCSLVGYIRFSVPEHHNQTNKYVYRQSQGAVQN